MLERNIKNKTNKMKKRKYDVDTGNKWSFECQ